MHKRAVVVGHVIGFQFIGLAAYLFLLGVTPDSWSSGMLPKVSMVLGGILLVGGIIWQLSSPGRAQVAGQDPAQSIPKAQTFSSAPTDVKPVDSPKPAAPGQVISNNSGIVTHEQTGNNTIDHGSSGR